MPALGGAEHRPGQRMGTHHMVPDGDAEQGGVLRVADHRCYRTSRDPEATGGYSPRPGSGQQETMTETPFDPTSLADEIAAGGRLEPFTGRVPGFGLDEAYRVAGILACRRAAGSPVVGRKIGFTNQSFWEGAGLDRPVWGSMFADSVVRSGGVAPRIEVAGSAEPKIECEVVVVLGGAPRARRPGRRGGPARSGRSASGSRSWTRRSPAGRCARRTPSPSAGSTTRSRSAGSSRSRIPKRPRRRWRRSWSR